MHLVLVLVTKVSVIAKKIYFDFAIGKKASSDKVTCFSKCDLVYIMQ